MFDDILETPPNTVPAEGFALLARNGRTDVVLIQHVSYPGVSDAPSVLAFDLDDFDQDSLPQPLVIGAEDSVEPLGSAKEYFRPKAPLWDTISAIVMAIPRQCGLLPTVRAVESLKKLGRPPTKGEIDNAVQVALADYQKRRALA